MPALIPMAVGALVTQGAVLLGATALVSQIAGAVASFAVSSMMSSGGSAGSSGSEIFENQARGALINTSSTVEPIPVVYGTRRKGGTRVLTEIYDTGAQNIAVVVVLAEGEISGVSKIYLDTEEAYPSPVPRFASWSGFGIELGTDDQAANALLLARIPSKWTTDHRLRGVAYIVALLGFNAEAFPGGLPNITADVAGKLVYDFRDATTKFSNNPALCLYDYLTNTRYGKGIPAASIDVASFTVAANYCDEPVAVPDGAGGTTTQARYTCDGVLNPDNGLLDNVRSLLTSCRGMLVFSGGFYRLIMDREQAASGFVFNEDNIVGGWSIQMTAKRSRFNRVKARFFNPAREWQPDFAIYENATYRAQDNGLVLEAELDLPFTANLYRAQQIAMLEGKQSRFGTVVRFRATIAALACDVGDVVAVTHSTPAWTAKLFRVMRLALLNTDEVEVTLREYDASVYTLDALSESTGAPTAGLPNPLTVTAPQNLVLTSGTAELFVAGDGTVHSRIKATWTPSTDGFVTSGGHTEIQFRKTAGSPEQDWSPSLFFDGSLSQAFLDPVDDGDTYSVRIRFENRIGVRSSWTEGSHTVAGKTALPEDVTGFTAQQNGNVVVFRWNQVGDVDLAGYEIRYGLTGIAWADATPLTQVTRGTQITTAAVPPGDWDTLIKARDTSGNYSAGAARYSLNLDTDFEVIASSEQAPRWPGSRTNFVKHWTGVLIPESTKLASQHTNAELFEQFVPYPYATCTYEAPEMGLAFDANVRAWADIDSVLGPGITTGIADPQLQIDYRTGAGAYDGYENWTIGTIHARYVKHRLELDTSRGKAVIRGFDPTLDAEEVTIGDDEVTVAAGGSMITFDPRFHNVPRVQVSAQAAGGAVRNATYESVAATGFTARVFNGAGADIGGTINWDATGV